MERRVFYDFTICRQCFMEGFEGSSMAGVGNFKVCVGISKTGFIVVRTGGKSISYFCEGSS